MTSLEFYDCPVVIPYYGGKFRLSKQLIPLLPNHSRYIEVFSGGLSMFFRKSKCDYTVINDIDNDIINLYRCLSEKYDEFIDTLLWVPKSRQMFEEARHEVHYSKVIKMPNVLRAVKYFYCIRNAFNKNPNSSFSKTSYWDTEDIIDKLKYSVKYFKNTTIENMDFRKLVVDYKPTLGDMWYFDPPYIVATEKGDYYMADFGYEEHEDLRECIDLVDRNGGKFMISYDDKEIVRDMYSDYNIVEIQTQYAGRTQNGYKEGQNTKYFTELVIMNYEEKTQVEMFKE